MAGSWKWRHFKAVGASFVVRGFLTAGAQVSLAQDVPQKLVMRAASKSFMVQPDEV
jgi:hypothetical protein